MKGQIVIFLNEFWSTLHQVLMVLYLLPACTPASSLSWARTLAMAASWAFCPGEIPCSASTAFRSAWCWSHPGRDSKTLGTFAAAIASCWRITNSWGLVLLLFFITNSWGLLFL